MLTNFILDAYFSLCARHCDHQFIVYKKLTYDIDLFLALSQSRPTLVVSPNKIQRPHNLPLIGYIPVQNVLYIYLFFFLFSFIERGFHIEVYR